ncbi:hypothetical protein BH11MYX4_BH11MYX4_39570 [soil metagenome]
MRMSNLLGVASAALMVGVVACGGNSKGPESATSTSAPAAGASGEKLTSKPPPSPPEAAKDTSPKTVCANVKPVAVAASEPAMSGGPARSLFATDKDDGRDAAVGSKKARGDNPFSMPDLKALEAKGQWRELVMHLDDVPPAKRDAAWEALLQKAAPEFMAQSAKEKDAFEGFYMASHLVDKYPQLTKNKAFMDKRLEVSKTAFKECFAQSYRGARCLKAAQEFVATGENNADSSFAIGKVVRLGQNANVAIPFFQKGLEGRKAGDASCADEDLKLSVMSALALPPDYDNAKIGRAVAVGVCFDKLRPAIEAEFKDSSTGYYPENACSVLKSKNAL